jgi:hypothetical protein
MSEELADRRLHLYGLPVIEFTLTRAVASWIRKCKRENVDPVADPYYLRNYLQSAMWSNLEKKFVVRTEAGPR